MEARTEKLELHYFFDKNDHSHTMNAVVRNRCEHELLLLVSAISQELHIQIEVESEPPKEGGYQDVYKFLTSAEGVALESGITLIVVLLQWIFKKSKLDREEQRLSIEEKKLNILKLQQELEQKEIKIEPITIDKVNYVVNHIKIVKKTSNFYQTLEKYKKVEKISFTKLDDNNKPVEEPVFVPRDEFTRFILESDDLEPEIDDEAVIEIISPVLKPGKFKWKGIYTKSEHPIEFSMIDKDFKKEINKGAIPFTSGTSIKCILEISKRIDDLGNVYNSNYKVLLVSGYSVGTRQVETAQGKKLRYEKQAPTQRSLDFPEDKKDGINFPDNEDGSPF